MRLKLGEWVNMDKPPVMVRSRKPQILQDGRSLKLKPKMVGSHKVVSSTDHSVTVYIQGLHKGVSIKRVTIATKREEKKSQVDKMQNFIIDDSSKETTPVVSAKHERDVRYGGPKPITTRQSYMQAIASELQVCVVQQIVDHLDEENGTLYKV